MRARVATCRSVLRSAAYRFGVCVIAGRHQLEPESAVSIGSFATMPFGTFGENDIVSLLCEMKNEHCTGNTTCAKQTVYSSSHSLAVDIFKSTSCGILLIYQHAMNLVNTGSI